jgi:hypothetical protein
MALLMMPNFRAVPVALALAGGICGWSPAAFAQSPPPPPTTQPAAPMAMDAGTIRLGDEQRDALLDANTEERAAGARGELAGSERPDQGIHGEFGVMIGSNGTRGAYGVAEIPLGDNAGAMVSFENSRFGNRRSRLNPRDRLLPFPR